MEEEEFGNLRRAEGSGSYRPFTFVRPPNVLLLMGPPGAGKSTAARLAIMDLFVSEADRLIEHVSTGDLVRRFGTPEERAAIAAGAFTPDTVMMRMLVQCANGVSARAREGKDPLILLDGFPRTAAQADWLLRHAHVIARVMFEVDRQTAIDRLMRRRIDPETGETFGEDLALRPQNSERALIRRPEDGSPETLERRFNDFRTKTGAAIYRLASQGVDTGLPIRCVIDANQRPAMAAFELVNIVRYVISRHIVNRRINSH